MPAIENLHEICSVPGLDAVLIGPHDLSCSLGIPEQYDHPRFDEAVRTIFRIAREHGVGAGIHFWLGLEQEIAWAKAGGNLVMHSSDLAAFSRTLKAEIEQLRKALELRRMSAPATEPAPLSRRRPAARCWPSRSSAGCAPACTWRSRS